MKRTIALFGIVALTLIAVPEVSLAQNSTAYSYVANTAPPDAFLALKSYPSPNSSRIMAMANGTKMDVLFRRVDGWWYVKVWPTGEEGWAFSGKGSKAYILCCATAEGAEADARPAAREITAFTCQELWFGRNSLYKEAGYCFRTPRAISAFGNAGCQFDNVNDVRLSPDNEAFVSTIKRVEQAKGCTP